MTSGAAVVEDMTLAAARPGPTCKPGAFVDVAANWCDDVTWLLGAHITAGTSPSTFGGGGDVTRGQLALLLYRLAHDGTAAPACAPGQSTFVDVPDGSLACGAIAWLVQAGIANGTDASHFAPGGAVTRGQAALLLYRLANAGQAAPACGSAPFDDVPSDALACGAIGWAVRQGVTRGTDVTHFSPGRPVTRYQAAGLLHRTQELTRIHGTITDGATHLPLAGVVVTIYGTFGTTATFSTVTGPDGTYAVAGIPAGGYGVCFDPAGAVGAPVGGYANECYDGVIGGLYSFPVGVTRWVPTIASAFLVSPLS